MRSSYVIPSRLHIPFDNVLLLRLSSSLSCHPSFFTFGVRYIHMQGNLTVPFSAHRIPHLETRATHACKEPNVLARGLLSRPFIIRYYSSLAINHSACQGVGPIATSGCTMWTMDTGESCAFAMSRAALQFFRHSSFCMQSRGELHQLVTRNTRSWRRHCFP